MKQELQTIDKQLEEILALYREGSISMEQAIEQIKLITQN